ncbi:MAG: type I DNA topoisomerase [Muribaculaceae bacterium]
MSKNLVIVESPAKAKTIEKFLGPEYKVMSSYGHIRDLKSRSFSIDIDAGFAPIYEIPEDKREIVDQLRREAAKADCVWLASDEDREGEAIAWHLAEVLGLDPADTRRIVFHEITRKAILNALQHPRTIDLRRVDAQQARRVLDRIVGFELSPVLWRKVKPQLSAGRVQSVAVRLIVEREKEIRDFVAEPFWRVTAALVNEHGEPIRASLARRLANADDARRLLSACASASFSVGEVSTQPLAKSPAAPFTTSTLQQEAARKLGFTVAQTMMVAQRLYEAGHITYMRTDSLNLSEEAISAIATEVKNVYGDKYLHSRRYHTNSKGAQEAHEAIRPTDISVAAPDELGEREKRLYTLIRRRTIASQMADAQILKTTAEINISGYSDRLTATGEVVAFDGFLHVYSESHDDETVENPQGSSMLPRLTTGQPLTMVEVVATERFTQQPPRFTEASLVKKMEELGIGRPSTYAPTISTIQNRGYIEKGEREGVNRSYEVMTVTPGSAIVTDSRSEVVGAEKGKLIPTDIGVVANDFLTQYFPEILDFNFTAKVEERFDDIAEGKLPWDSEVRDFYDDFHPRVDTAMNMRLEHKVGERLLGTDPDGRPVSVKIGRYGPLVQIGDADADVKPQFASLLKDQSMATITLEEALKLFEFPRVLGEYEDKEVSVAIGRFGPYVRHDKLFVSIPKDVAPAEVTLDQAIELINEKRQGEARRVVKTFDEDPDTRILNGRYGIYIASKGANYKIPKSVTDPAALSLEQVREIIATQADKPAKTSTRRVSRKK